MIATPYLKRGEEREREREFEIMIMASLSSRV